MQTNDLSQRALAELRRRYEDLVAVYDQVPLETLNEHLPPHMRFRSKSEMVFQRILGISTASEFALAIGVASLEDVRSLLHEFESRRPDIFRNTEPW